MIISMSISALLIKLNHNYNSDANKINKSICVHDSFNNERSTSLQFHVNAVDLKTQGESMNANAVRTSAWM